MQISVGTDIIEVERIRDSLAKHGDAFLNRLFTENEQRYFSQFEDATTTISGRFAAKEAIAKALGTGFGKDLSWSEIEIINNGEGKPLASLSERALQHFNHPTIEVSISHCKTHATATAVVYHSK